mmetsp:Transcript_17766/g.49223  ORF Transcript_17766/g.49223 Transcript_17766/m.49223 type:complete len:124 (-) Transcript_17766:54-425(-)
MSSCRLEKSAGDDPILYGLFVFDRAPETGVRTTKACVNGNAFDDEATARITAASASGSGSVDGDGAAVEDRNSFMANRMQFLVFQWNDLWAGEFGNAERINILRYRTLGTIKPVEEQDYSFGA